MRNALLVLFVIAGFAATAAGAETSENKDQDFHEKFVAGKVTLTCRITCSFEFGWSRSKLLKLETDLAWEALAGRVAEINHSDTLAYYYLAKSALRLGHLDAASAYIAATRVRISCILGVCDGHDVEADLIKFESEIAQAKLGLAKQDSIPNNKNIRSIKENSMPGIALVIGNSKYENLGTLSNTAKDAKDVDKTLREMGYKSKLVLDADYGTLRKEIKAFSAESEKSPIAIIFYAGHGAQINQENYLLPTDIEIPKRETDIQLSAVKVDDLINYLKSKTKVVFLDACRDNPALIKTLSKGRGAYRGGLAPISSTSLDDRSSGIFVAYATDSGNVALDGDGVNSPFTKALIKYIKRPVSIDDMFSMVTKDVLRETKNAQKPYKYASMDSIVCLPGGCQSADDISNIVRADSQVDKDTSRAFKGGQLPSQWVIFERLKDKKDIFYINPNSITRGGNRVWEESKLVAEDGAVTFYSNVVDCVTQQGYLYAIKSYDPSGKMIQNGIWGNPRTVALSVDYSGGTGSTINSARRTLICDVEKVTPLTVISEGFIRFYTMTGGELYYLQPSVDATLSHKLVVKFDIGKNVPFNEVHKRTNMLASFEGVTNLTAPVRYLVYSTIFQCDDKTLYATTGNLYAENGELVAYVDYLNLNKEFRAKVNDPNNHWGQLFQMACN